MIVVDASLFVAWLLDEPDFVPASDIFDRLSAETALVPAHWPVEVGNALRKAVRTRRLKADEIGPVTERMAILPVVVATPITKLAIGPLVAFALSQQLSVYDAAYVRLAVEHGRPLATLDSAMRAAARALNIALLPA